jgi:hypothetical protein
VALEEAGFVLCNIGASAGSQNRNLLLDLLNIILAGLEIDLEIRQLWSERWASTIEIRNEKIQIGRKAYVFDGNDLAVGLVNGLVNNTKTAACKRKIRLADEIAKKK